MLLVCGPAAGGMRRHLQALSAGLPERGFEVAVAAPPSVSVAGLGDRFALDLGDRPRPLSDWGAMKAFQRAVREWRPDLVHAHGVKAALLCLAALPDRPPVVVTFHNLWHGGPLTLPLRLLAPRAAATVAVSVAVRDRLVERRICHEKPVVIPNGLDLGSFPAAPPPPPGRPFTAAFLGRLTEEKGVPVLLEAARRWEARLVIAGDGPLRAEVEAEAAGGASRIEYRGLQEDVLPIYHGADVVVMPSLSEGHPMTALEAMACGLPLVASRVGGLPEIVVEGETGVLVPPGDASALVAAVDRLADDPERGRAMGAAGRQRVVAEFAVEGMLERVVEVYQGVLGRGR